MLLILTTLDSTVQHPPQGEPASAPFRNLSNPQISLTAAALRKIAHKYYMDRVQELHAGMQLCQDQFRCAALPLSNHAHR